MILNFNFVITMYDKLFNKNFEQMEKDIGYKIKITF